MLSRIEFALRATLIAVLPVCALITADDTAHVFVTRALATTIAIALVNQTTGKTVAVVAELIRSIIVWLPLTTIVAALEMHRITAWWWIAYIAGALFIGVVAEGFSRKLALFYYTLCLLAQLSPGEVGKQTDYPSRLCRDSLIGAAFALAAPLIPPFRTSSRIAQTALEQVFDDISVCYTGLSEAFWAPTNLNRSVDVAKVKFVMGQMNEAMQRCLAAVGEAEYEHLGASRALTDMRMRVELCRELKYSLDSLVRAVEIIEASPEIIDASHNAQKYGDIMRQPLIDVANAADTLLQCLSRPQDDDKLRVLVEASDHITELQNTSFGTTLLGGGGGGGETRSTFNNAPYGSPSDEDSPGSGATTEELVAAATAISPRCGVEQHVLCSLLMVHKRMEETFVRARREIFYRDNLLRRIEDYHMVNGFFMFHHRLFVKALANFVDRRRQYEAETQKKWCSGLPGQWWAFFSSPLFATVARLRLTVQKRKVRVFKESFKTALALALSVLFFLQYEPNTAIISGPSVVALISGNNTGEAMNASMMRLIGTLFGAVISFFTVTIATNPWHIVIGLCVVIFVFTFFKTGDKYGAAASYASIVACAVAVPNQTSEAAMRRVQQNTFAIIIYVVIANLLFPKVPSRMLKTIRERALQQTAASCTLLLGRHTWFEQLRDRMGARGIDVTAPLPLGGGVIPPGLNDVIREKHEKWLAECESQIKVLAGTLRVEKDTLPLAGEEPTLRRRPFPSILARDFFLTQEKFASLLVTMHAAWRVVLLEASPLDDQHSVKRITASVAPYVRDFCATVLDAFNMIMVVITDPHANLTADLTRCTLQARAQALDILAAQRRAMLLMIPQHVAQQQQQVRHESPTAVHVNFADYNTPMSHDGSDDDETTQGAGRGGQNKRSSEAEAHAFLHEAVDPALTECDDEIVSGLVASQSRNAATVAVLPPLHLNRPAARDPIDSSSSLLTMGPRDRTHTASFPSSPSLQPKEQRQSSNLSTATAQRQQQQQQQSNLTHHHFTVTSPVREPTTELADGPLPISSLDAAALHSLVLCCISIGYELRKLFVQAEALQHDQAAAIGY